jgi:hypothetical protein
MLSPLPPVSPTLIFFNCKLAGQGPAQIGLELTYTSALTLEFLETAFYQQGFAKFPDSDFLALGLSATDLADLKNIGQTEAAHVTTLLTAIAGAGTAPVAPCEYNFGFTTAAGMVATANVLENVGVSA